MKAERELIAAADRNQLSFVIRNLVNNAIKFTNPQGLISIKTGLQNDNRLCISVADNGTGIEDNVLQNIRNLRVDRSVLGTVGEKGTGLGLLLCYEFVSQNNGHIDVKSNPGQGTTFNVFLDRYQAV